MADFLCFNDSRPILGFYDGSHMAKWSVLRSGQPRAACVVVNIYVRIDTRIYP